MAGIEVELSTEEPRLEADVVFIGAGPVGLWTAIQAKLRNPDLKIVMYEKYPEYKRKHVLKMNKDSFKGIPEDERLQQIVDDFPTFVRTSVIEENFKNYALELSIEINYEKVESCEVLASHYPDDTVFIGSDGSHSLVRHEIFDYKLQVGQDLQYIAEIKYMVEGETSELNSATELLPVMSHSKFTASEHVGSKNGGLTPVTVRFFVDEETFNQLRGEDGNGAKFSNPFHYEDLSNGNVPEKLANSVKAWLYWRRRLKNENRVQHEASSQNGEKITAINLAVYASEEFVAEEYGKKMGDCW